MAALVAAVVRGWRRPRGLGFLIWNRRKSIAPSMRGPRTAVVWVLQTLLVCLLLFLLWQPAVSIATLRPQQNIVAVVIDDSKSMATSEDGKIPQGSGS